MNTDDERSWKAHHGRPISLIDFLAGGGIIRASDSVFLVLYYEFHGDYDDAWVLEIHGGTERARHNVKGIATIAWRET